MILLDTSGLLASLDDAQTRHREAAASLHDATAPLVLSPFVLAELDYLVGDEWANVPASHCSRKSSAGSTRCCRP